MLSVFLQGWESGKSIFRRLGMLNLTMDPYTDGIPDHLIPNRAKKCIPGTPRCVRCTAIGIEDCSYRSVMKRGTGNTLATGRACVLCR